MTGQQEEGPTSPRGSQLRVRLLGFPTVSWRGQTLDVPRRQVRALLFRLAATPLPLPRERLCYLFWADTAESAARRSLSRLLSHLRGALPDPRLLLTPAGSVALDSERVFCDVVAFQQLADRDEDIDALRRAAELYRGPFLAGFSLAGSPEFEAWILEQQRVYERRYLEALKALIESTTRRQQYDQAIAYAQRYLATDELGEDVHRRLIHLYAATGDRMAAQRQFERCVAVLERELGVRPLPETREAYEKALDGRRPRQARTAPHLSWATLPTSLDVPLVGREKVCGRLREALAQARAGHGQIVLLSGEQGIGKSRLMETFAARSKDRALVLAAAALAREQALPYQPVAEVLRSVPQPQILTAATQPVWLAEAARLLPELRDRHPDLPRPLPTEPLEARTRLLEALCRMTLGLARRQRPLLICLDDLHWADSGTLDWLLGLSRHMAQAAGAGCPMLVLGTYRTEDQEAMNELRHHLTRLGVLSEVRLTGLKPDAVLQIVRHVTEARPGAAALSRRLHRATGGNPFFLVETLRVLQEAGDLSEDLTALETIPLPSTVQQAIEARLRRLDPQARQVLEAGASLGDPFSFELVRRTAGRREMETINSLDDTVARQLLIEDAAGYRFRHALIRQAVEATLSPVRRHLLHRRAARALKEIDAQATGRIARHLELGGEEQHALEYYRQATRRARELFAWQEAERIQGRMLRLLDRLDPDHSKREYRAVRGEILTDRAHLRYLQGRLADRDADLAALASLAEANDDDDLRLLTALHRVRYLNLGGSYQEAIAEGEQGLTLARRMGDGSAEARLLAHVGFAHYFLGEPQPALTALEEAMEASGEEMTLTMRGRIAHILGYVTYHLGQYSEALAHHLEAYRCSARMADHNRTAWNLMDVGFLHLKLGRLSQAEACLRASLALARQIDADPAEAYAETLLGDWHLCRGSYAAALDRFRASLDRQVAVGSRHGVVAAEDGAGFALYHLGELDRARKTLQRALDHALEIGHRRHVALALIGLGLVEMAKPAEGSAHAARKHVKEALTVARESQCPENVAYALAALARADRQRGRPAAALDHAREAAQVAEQHDLPSCRVWADVETGLALLAQEKPQEALDYTKSSLEALPHMHQDCIGSEEVRGANTRVLEALGCAGEAREQAALAAAAIQAKAERIPDSQRRERYQQFARSRIR